MHLITTAPAGLNVDEINAFHLLLGGYPMRAGATSDAPVELINALQFAHSHDLGQMFGTVEAWMGIAACESEFFASLVGVPAPYTGPGVDVFVGHMSGSNF